MVLCGVQGGESRVLDLADEVQARRQELSGLQQQVKQAQALNAQLKSRLVVQEQGTAEATPA